ncbi:HPr kinase/phosphorylase [Sagittula sp.]|uniref:HPr kinase/phosphorylase n=1 Tax=Sagittula sp. TaxID=2038081 RepID=UPI003517E5B1
MSETLIHASSVAVAGRGLLIRGRSGAGKSALALELLALGATLVADDRTLVSLRDGRLWMDAPETIRGMIEARGLGILNAQSAPAPLAAIVDLDSEETERLPPIRKSTLLGMDVPLLHKTARPYFPAALVQYLKAGRRE